MTTKSQYVELADWDPLSIGGTDPGLIDAAKKREILNILKSYTGYYDLFSELIQNSLDAVERQAKENIPDYKAKVWITINMQHGSISVTDNGCGMTRQQFEQFLQPNLSFKDGNTSRGSKGVGATYLGYGFNHLEVATRNGDKAFAGILKDGREWLEDKTGSIGRPKVTGTAIVTHAPFQDIDCGTSMTLKLAGKYVRPANLNYNGAKNAEQWLAILRVKTPLGGIYLRPQELPNQTVYLQVIDPDGKVTDTKLEKPTYLYPHTVFSRTQDLRIYLDDQKKRVEKNQDITKIPPKYTQLSGIWGKWTIEEILAGNSPLTARLNSEDEAHARQLGISLYIFLGYSTEQWDEYNDKKLGVRKAMRLLKGGLQLATKNMPQGELLTIPLTNNIGFQNIAHVVIHFENAEPDLGRKGFQPDDVEIAEKLSVSAVTALRKFFPHMLRQSTGAPVFEQQIKLKDWIAIQREHEKKSPLIIKGKGLFQPTEELPIRSIPVVEQDVVALFNQMLSSGIVRGIQLLASSQYRQYDGLFRVIMDPPFEKYILGDENPLGIDSSHFEGKSSTFGSLEHLQILEYKYDVDALIEEFKTGEKSPDEVGLVVAWQIGTKWRESFNVVSYLDPDNVHLRGWHGLTHRFSHSAIGTQTFEAIILQDLVNYLLHPEEEASRQRKEFAQDL